MQGAHQFDLEDLRPGTRSRELVMTLARIFQEGGVPEDEAFDRVHDLLFSETLDRVPKLRIQSLLWAGMAHQAAKGGRQRPPGRGAMTDVNIISTVLPYCDAVLIENEMRGPSGSRSRPRPPRLRDEGVLAADRALDYLTSVEEEAPKGITDLAKSIYGEPEPYLTIFHDPDYRLGTNTR